MIRSIAESLIREEYDLCARYVALNPEDRKHREAQRDLIVEGIRRLRDRVKEEEQHDSRQR